jgi:hypothetical protein
LPTKELLNVRLRDLDVEIEGTWLEPLLERVYEELAERGLRFRPDAWVSDEWASPDGIAGVQVPFYVLHPRLKALERRMMHYCEGGSQREALRLLRHEVGHSVQHAWALQRRADWRGVFGRSRPYPSEYRPNPSSRAYVQHLPGWYAQSHPSEDFAETFAVWLNPTSAWRRKYAGWRALHKLEYVDALAHKLPGLKRVARSRARPHALRTLRSTLAEYYEAKRAHYGTGYSDTYDGDLLRLFSDDPAHAGNEGAASFVRRHRRLLRETVSRGTGQHTFVVDQVVDEILGRCRELGLRTRGDARTLRLELTIMLTAHTVHAIHSRQWRAV